MTLQGTTAVQNAPSCVNCHLLWDSNIDHTTEQIPNLAVVDIVQRRQPISTAIRGTHGGTAALFAPPPYHPFASNPIHPCTQPSWIHLWRDGQQSSLQACTLSSFLFFSPLLCASFIVLTGLLIVEQRVCYNAEGATAIYLGYTWREEHINVYVDLTPFSLNADALLCYLQLWARTNAEQVSCSFFYRGLHHRMLKLRLYEAISCQIIQRGPPDSAYAGGEYHGQLIFPSEYPFKPPGIKVRFFIHYDIPHRSISAEIWHLTYISRCWPRREDFSLAKKFASRCRIFIQEL